MALAQNKNEPIYIKSKTPTRLEGSKNTHLYVSYNLRYMNAHIHAIRVKKITWLAQDLSKSELGLGYKECPVMHARG